MTILQKDGPSNLHVPSDFTEVQMFILFHRLLDVNMFTFDPSMRHKPSFVIFVHCGSPSNTEQNWVYYRNWQLSISKCVREGNVEDCNWSLSLSNNLPHPSLTIHSQSVFVWGEKYLPFPLHCSSTEFSLYVHGQTFLVFQYLSTCLQDSGIMGEDNLYSQSNNS